METHLARGDKAPDFSLPATGSQQSLKDYLGQWLVLYFYPKDNTPGCTTQACDFRDAAVSMKAAVLGVSPDSVASHEGFADTNSLPFPLASDENFEVAKAYGAYGEKTVFGKTTTGLIRSTFIISPDGRIAEAMYNVRAAGHVERVLERLTELQA